jgi:hypothetical protein
MPAISIPARRRPIVLYGTDELYWDIQEHAARDLMSASAWMRQVILDRLRNDTEVNLTSAR